MAQLPVATPPTGNRSRGSSGASMNRYNPENYLAASAAQNNSAGPNAYFPPHDLTRPMNQNSLTPTMPQYQQTSSYGPPTSHPAHLQPQLHGPGQYTPGYSGPSTPHSGPHTPYSGPQTPYQNPPYPVSDPWNSAGQPPPSAAPAPMNPERRASTSTSFPHGYPNGHRPPPDVGHSDGQHHYRRSSSIGRPGEDHHRRSSSSGREHHHHHHHSTEGDYEHRPKHHHHHHENDLKKYDTHRPTVGDTMAGMIGVVKDYLGPVHRD